MRADSIVTLAQELCGLHFLMARFELLLTVLQRNIEMF
jgi:hypothetical protein